MANSRDPSKGQIAQWLKKAKIEHIDETALGEGKKRSEWVESAIDIGLYLAKNKITKEELLELVNKKKKERKINETDKTNK